MPGIASFPDGEHTITVHFTDGQTRVGRIRSFDPASEIVLGTLPGPGQQDAPRTGGIVVPERVAYIAVHRADHAPVPKTDRPSSETFIVHLSLERTVTVRADRSAVTDALGFVGFPDSDLGLYSTYWFYTHAVRRVERVEPLGALLLEDGILLPTDLEAGLARQAAERNVRLGDVLVDAELVSSEAVKRAAEQQALQGARRQSPRLGEILVEAGLATNQEIARALEMQKQRRGKRLGQILVEMGIVKETSISETLARKFSMPFVDLDRMGVDSTALSQVPFDIIERFQLLPIRSDEHSVTIALADPLALEGTDMLRFHLDKVVHEVVVTPSQLARHLDPLLSRSEGPEAAAAGAIVPGEPAAVRASTDDNRDVVEFINHMIADAYLRRASDIHVEPNGEDRPTLVRLRIDGECETAWHVPAHQRAQLVARLKVMASLNIAEKRKPQDGKMDFKVGKQKIELRVAIIPTVLGDEDMVLRILTAAEPLPVEKMGFSLRDHAEIGKLIASPHGLVLVVGPTGSGKTTTLHSLLKVLNKDRTKIITAEDPVEIVQPGLRQVQMHASIGLDFAAALRSFLRSDPDVIMVGEMRDLETATIGVEASLTGHLVFSTLHTNSAPETITRLIDLGLDRFMFADALLGVLAQRLVRRLCGQCKRPEAPTSDEEARLIHLLGPAAWDACTSSGPVQLWRVAGCPACQGKGYRGRVAVHELLVSGEEIRAAIQRRGTVAEIRAQARANGMTTLLEDGIAKCLLGQTDLKHVLAVCG